MAVSYDYYECVKLLLDAGADAKITNQAGFPCFKGIDGDKSLGVCQLISAKDGKTVREALEACNCAQSGEIEKSSFVQAGLKTKKLIGSEWTPEVDSTFKSILGKLGK